MIKVVAGIIIRENEVLIAKRKHGKHLAGFWEFPGGKSDNDETEPVTLNRELKEEVGIEVKKYKEFYQNTHAFKDKTILLVSYLVLEYSGTIENHEHDDIKWVKFGDLLNYKFSPADEPIVNKLHLEFNNNFKRAYYSETITTFLASTKKLILGSLLESHTNQKLTDLQRNAWISQIDILKETLHGLSGKIYFEFAIPRMGKRVDNIIIVKDKVFVIEFKVGEATFPKYAIDQVIDYSLDLKNFHEGSHKANIVPVLISTNAIAEPHNKESVFKLEAALKIGKLELGKSIAAFTKNDNECVQIQEWENSIYKPTPTIIEAAKALYKGHNVEEISRSDSGAINLTITSKRLSEIISVSKKTNKKSICFVTGVPGAGKTLAGLNIANERNKIDQQEHSVFLSGNGPLVKVLREALADDLYESKKAIGKKIKKDEARRSTSAFIQNIHHFRDEYLQDDHAPVEKVVVFDEAQRAWNKNQAKKFMKRKKGIQDFEQSEPEFLISVMDRNKDWCTIICLIGGGQEINVGEAGLEEWISAIQKNFADWDVYYSDQIIQNKNYLNIGKEKDWLLKNGVKKEDLHLAVSVRSFRSEKISELVEEILSVNQQRAKEVYNTIQNKFPIVITRDLSKAKRWLKSMQKGTERVGIISSSGARRLKANGIDVKNEINPVNWFLKGKQDVRSSNFLENIATEFDIQGLEIDYTCLAWGANFYLKKSVWNYKRFSGTKWQAIKKKVDQNYLLNTYRVLLTRARQGMVIYIPLGDNDDITRKPELYDETYEFFKDIGFKEL